MRLLYPLAKRFIAGEDLETALKAIDRLHRRGFRTTIDLLGEHVRTQEQAEAAKQAYLGLFQRMQDSSVRMDFSIKLTQLGLDIDRAYCKENVVALANAAGSHTIRFDIEGSAHTEPIIRTCRDLHPTYNKLGQAVQAYLYRTEKDLDDLIREGISVRLCKGAYKEPPSIAYQSMEDIRANFLKLAYRLLKEGHEPAIATHDEYLLTEILEFIQKEKIEPESFYFEMLYGVARDLQKTLLRKGYRVRIYVPYGKSWLPYTLRRLTEKKENMFFVAKNLFREAFRLRKLK